MKKCDSGQKDFGEVILVRRLNVDGEHLKLCATPEQCQALSDMFDVPEIHNLTATLDIDVGDVIRVSGRLRADLKRTCVVTGDIIPEKMDVPFSVLFSEKGLDASVPSDIDLDMEDDDIDEIKNGRIYVKPMLFEQFGLNLNPYPKKTTGTFSYTDAADGLAETTENPFCVLKTLTKK